MLKRIYGELILIRKELQAIRSSLEPEKFVPEDSSGKFFVSTATNKNRGYQPKTKVVLKYGRAIRVPINYDNSSRTES